MAAQREHTEADIGESSMQQHDHGDVNSGNGSSTSGSGNANHALILEPEVLSCTTRTPTKPTKSTNTDRAFISYHSASLVSLTKLFVGWVRPMNDSLSQLISMSTSTSTSTSTGANLHKCS
jgi:hypothetical protein